MNFPAILSPEAAQVWYLNRQLHLYEGLPASKQQEIQMRSLQGLLAWGHTHSVFWRERLGRIGWTNQSDPWMALQALAPLTRFDIQDNFEALSCAHALSPDSCTLAHSTGSTGQPVRVLKYRNPYHLRYLAYARRGSLWHGLDVRKPIMRQGARAQDGSASSWGSPEAWFAETGPSTFVRTIERDISEMYAPIKQHHPSYMVAVASVAKNLAQYALAHDANDLPKLEAILTTGDAVTEQIRAVCHAAFGAKIINRYTCEEAGWLALQCPKHNHLHVLSANVIIEIVDGEGRPCKPGQPGRVLVTALHSEAMPLIRYDIGDVAEWGEGCDCGIGLPVIRRIWGREQEFIRTSSGELRYVVLIGEEFLEIAPIRDMRFRYYKNPLIRFEVVCDTELSVDQRLSLMAKVQKMLGFDCPVEIVQLPVINWGLTDKRLAFAAVDSVWSGG